MKEYRVDWRLLGGFSALLLLMIIIGIIGILQIKSLTEAVDNLGRRHLPMQTAVLEMKINNNLYAMGIRNYVFWKGSRYLEAARAAADLGGVRKAAEEFDRQLTVYSSYVKSIPIEPREDLYGADKQKQWIKEIAVLEGELRDLGSRIISLVDQSASLDSVNRLLMTFESKMYRIDDFLDQTIQNENLNAIKQQLRSAEAARKRAMLFLGWSLAFGVLIGVETARLVYKKLQREYNRRQDMVLQMIRTEERERQNLSAQVHDQMSQDLSAAMIYLDLIQQAAPNPSDKFMESLNKNKKVVSGLIEKAHNISLLLRPPSLDEVGLLDSLEALLVDHSQLTGADYIFQKPDEELKLMPEHSLFLYRFTQEVLTNAARYAQARNIELRLTKLGQQQLELFYRDDGKGFDYEGFLKRPRRRTEDKLKLGLLSLQERAELLGGSIRIDTAPGQGTRMVIKLPV